MGCATMSRRAFVRVLPSNINDYFDDFLIANGEMAERSKALASGASREICVGSSTFHYLSYNRNTN